MRTSAQNQQRRVYRGRIVTMDASDRIIAEGTVCIRGNEIVAVLQAGARLPLEFAAVGVTATGGTIYPGLIELHNHLIRFP